MKTPVGVEAAAAETPSLTGEVVGETHRGLEWVVEGVTEILQRVERVPLLPLSPSPMYSITVQQLALPRPGEHLKLHPFK